MTSGRNRIYRGVAATTTKAARVVPPFVLASFGLLNASNHVFQKCPFGGMMDAGSLLWFLVRGLKFMLPRR